MEKADNPDGEQTDEDNIRRSASLSLSSSMSSSHSLAEFRRQMRPPNKKKFEEEMDDVQAKIRTKEAEIKSYGTVSIETATNQVREIRAEKEASIGKRKKLDNDLKLINQEITRKMGQLSRTESNLHYKNEAKIDDAIHKMEWQLQSQNFRVSEERKIVAEVDKLKRSKKVLVEYFSQKREVDKLRDSQRRMRGEREHYYRAVTTLNRKEEDLKRTNQEKKLKYEECKRDLDQLKERKRQIAIMYKQTETEYQRSLNERRHRLRKESFKKREEERKAKEDARHKELLEYESQREPFEDEKNLCNTLISYLQRYTVEREDNPTLPSPRDEQPHTPFGSNQSLGPADSLDDGKFVLLKKSEEAESDYTVANKPRRRSKKDRRKLSVTKPLAHTPQIIAQFSSLNLCAPSNMSEVTASIELLQARKRFYDQQAMHVSRPLLGSLSGSFSSSGSLSLSGSLDSPLRERSNTWGFVPPAIAENQTLSDAGTSGESGFHDMSRQASKTESSESAAEGGAEGCTDLALEEMIKQSEEYGESETSRSSSDTITPEEQLVDDAEPHPVKLSTNIDHLGGDQSIDRDQSVDQDLAIAGATSQGNQGITGAVMSPNNQAMHSHDIDSADSSVFEEPAKPTSLGGELSKGRKSDQTSKRDHSDLTSRKESHSGTSHSARPTSERVSQEFCDDLSTKIENYDTDFPPTLQAGSSSRDSIGKREPATGKLEKQEQATDKLGKQEPASDKHCDLVLDKDQTEASDGKGDAKALPSDTETTGKPPDVAPSGDDVQQHFSIDSSQDSVTIGTSCASNRASDAIKRNGETRTAIIITDDNGNSVSSDTSLCKVTDSGDNVKSEVENRGDSDTIVSSEKVEKVVSDRKTDNGNPKQDSKHIREPVNVLDIRHGGESDTVVTDKLNSEMPDTKTQELDVVTHL